MKKLIFLFFNISFYLWASSNNLGGSAFPITKLIQNPYINSLGSATVADPSSPIFILNPAAGKSYKKKLYFSTAYTKWIEGIYGFSGLFNYKKYGFGIDYINEGNITTMNKIGVIGNTINNYALKIYGNYQFLFKRLALGISGNLISNKFLDDTYKDMSLSLGLQYQMTGHLSAGISLRNLGYLPHVPYSIDAGLAYSIYLKLIKINFYTAFNLDYDNFPKIKAGFSYIYNNYLDLRIGYTHKIAKTYQINKGLSMGLGISIFQYRIDFTYMPISGMEDSYQLALSSRINGFPIKQKKEESETSNFVPRKRTRKVHR